MQVWQHLDVNREHRRAGFREGLEILVRVRDHEVDVERHVGDALDAPHDGRADREIRDEMAVHDIHMNQVRPAAFGGGDGVGQPGEIGGKDGRRDAWSHRLTSIEIGSPGAI